MNLLIGCGRKIVEPFSPVYSHISLREAAAITNPRSLRLAKNTGLATTDGVGTNYFHAKKIVIAIKAMRREAISGFRLSTKTGSRRRLAVRVGFGVFAGLLFDHTQLRRDAQFVSLGETPA